MNGHLHGIDARCIAFPHLHHLLVPELADTIVIGPGSIKTRVLTFPKVPLPTTIINSNDSIDRGRFYGSHLSDCGGLQWMGGSDAPVGRAHTRLATQFLQKVRLVIGTIIVYLLANPDPER